MNKTNKIINLTPHDISVFDDNGNLIKIFPVSGKIARISMTKKEVGQINGIKIFNSKPGDVIDLPEISETKKIVSVLVRTSFLSRKDLISPADLCRNINGEVLGCRSFDCNT